MRYLSGETEKLHFACYRLKYSRWVYVEITPNEQVEPLCRSLLRAFERSGGVPLAVVFDNPKTVVIHPKKEPIVWNRTLAQLSLDYGFAIELCEPRRGNQKGAVENLVGWVKGSFFKVRRFHDFEDLLQQLSAWLQEVNEERPSRATKQIPAAAPGRGAGETAAAEARPGGLRPALRGVRRPHGRGHSPRHPLRHAGRGDRLRGYALRLPGPGADHGRTARGRARPLPEPRHA